MERYPNYDAFLAAHERRAQDVRATAVAAAWHRRRDRFHRALRWRPARPHGPSGGAITRGHSPETLFWA